MALPPSVIPALLTFYLGAWDLAVCGDLILQGIIFAQVAHYTTLHKKDVLALRAFVAVLLIITTLKSAQVIVVMWIQNVEHFLNLEAALSMSTHSWTTQIDLVFVALIAFYVQLFFCQRLWGISRNVYIVALVLVIFVFALVAAIVSCVFTFAGQLKNVTWIEIHLATVFAGDVLLCGSTIYFLLYHSKYASPETAGMLNSITKLTFQSAAPAAICALISLVGTVAWDRTTPNAYVMLAIISNNVLPKLIRKAHSSTDREGTATTSGRRHTNNIELTDISSDLSVAIRVQTEMEATQSVLSSKHDRPYP
ncbi:hypothetical protein B0H16DRAFT_1714593 [Mycena metata]|uniref:Uncharacterized protein n=1 Tax=Mycena metata TaxID=1033252 RepID=A0AAD7JVC6_9AGAR|nr:hypothetical protein B0H16DRAFT_1714593 [Mycena metata]